MCHATDSERVLALFRFFPPPFPTPLIPCVCCCWRCRTSSSSATSVIADGDGRAERTAGPTGLVGNSGDTGGAEHVREDEATVGMARSEWGDASAVLSIEPGMHRLTLLICPRVFSILTRLSICFRCAVA